MLTEARQVELLKFAEVLAEAARPSILKAHAQVDTSIEIKADGTPVTIADCEAEGVMRALIKKSYPSHGILGEEFGSENIDAEFCWVLDPKPSARFVPMGRFEGDGPKPCLAATSGLDVRLAGLIFRCVFNSRSA